MLLSLAGVGLAAALGPGILTQLDAGSLADRAAFPLLVLGAQAYSLAILPLANAFSRSLEREADRFACRLTGRPSAFAAALRRLGTVNLVEWQPPRWAVWLFATHPPLRERVLAATQAARQL